MYSSLTTRAVLTYLVSGIAALLLGWANGYLLETCLAVALVFLVWNLVNLARLHRWLRNPGQAVPDSFGVWNDVFQQIRSLEQGGELNKEKFTAMLASFQALADAYPDTTLVLDDRGRLKWFNSAAQRNFELKDPDNIGQGVRNLIRFPGFQEWIDQLDGEEPGTEKKVFGKNDRWLEGNSVRIKDDQRLVILRDISDVRNVERMRRDFVTNVSHELRTPLTVMLGYLEIFLDNKPDNTEEAMKRMHAQAVQMQYMLDDFLELSRIQSEESEAEEARVNVPAMLTQLIEQAEEISRGDHELVFEIDNDLYLKGIAADLESAFRNLIVNALKYTPQGGTVTVNWNDSEIGPTLEVSDSGIGSPQREIPRLTERFYRVGSDRGRKSGGTGLGLAIVKNVLNRHQANLRIESKVGVGSQFARIFPKNRKMA